MNQPTPIRLAALVAWVAVAACAPLAAAASTESGARASAAALPAIVFVSRAIRDGGSIYLPAAKDMPGVGPHSRHRAAAPGRLVVREANGRLRVLIDGGRPTAASLQLADVSAPDVSYDGQRIVFAGLPKQAAGNAYGPEGYAGAWRIYTINVDGTGLARLTGEESGRAASLAALSLPAALLPIDDGDPAWLPNGGIVFSSTRFPSYAHYSGVRTSNLYTMGADGSGLRRITGERNGADRPQVDPNNGAIVFARWWRNHRLPVDSLATVADAVNGGYVRKDGLTTDTASQKPVAALMSRNAWHAATIDPDGTHLEMWSGVRRDDAANHYYGGSFEPDGKLLGNFYPMHNMTEAGGFGGVRRLVRRAGGATALIGVTELTDHEDMFVAPGSYGVYKLGPDGMADWYASDPCVLPDGRVIVSLANSIGQDYALYLINADGSGAALLLDNPGTSELRARPIVSRALPRVLPAATGPAPALMPPPATGPYDQSGTFEFHSHNAYFNAPVDVDIVNAPSVGSATSIRFFTDFQRQSTGSFPSLDWPVLLREAKVNPNGSSPVIDLPAGVPLFEQLRSADRKVPAVGGVEPNGSAHVAGLNHGARGTAALCVGCHAGHTQIQLPADIEETEFGNLATGASVAVSSTRDATSNIGLIDRKVKKGEIWRYWTSAAGRTSGEWVKLAFPVPVRVKTVRLYNPRPGEEAQSSVQVQASTVELCADTECAQVIASGSTGALQLAGTDVEFPRVKVRAVRVRIDSVTGTFYGQAVAGLAEIEVIARGEAP